MVVSSGVEHRDLFMEVCTWLETTMRDIFSHHGWQHNLRIQPPLAQAYLHLLIMICNTSYVRSDLFSSCIIDFGSAVCILVMQMLGVMLKLFK
jgi:hypothetical protein